MVVAYGCSHPWLAQDLKEVLQRLEQAGDAVISREKVLVSGTQLESGCHPFIGNLCSRLFYENQLINGITEQERSSALGPGVSPLAVVLSQGCAVAAGEECKGCFG
eukprot:Skav221099  [mRNA]  locus=scaffold4552:250657:258043:- [translate_table: standard]